MSRIDPTAFQRVKEAVDISEVAQHFGLVPDRRGWCCCPFHGEKTPSFHLYQQRYHCFGCDAHGDVMDLVAALLDVPLLEAAKEINEVFHLGIDLGTPADPVAVAMADAERERKRQFQAWRKDALLVLTRRFRALWLMVKVGGALVVPGSIPDAYANALREIETIGYYLDLLTFEEDEALREAMPAINGAVSRAKEEKCDVEKPEKGHGQAAG